MHISKSVKVLLIILLFIVVSLRVFALDSIFREEGLIGYWSFDDLTEGSSVFLDSSGNGRHGTLYNNTHCVEGRFGKALNFDGVSDYAKIPYDPGLSSPGAFSIEAWVYPTPPHRNGHNGGIICNINGREYNRILIRYDNNKLLGYFSVQPPGGRRHGNRAR